MSFEHDAMRADWPKVMVAMPVRNDAAWLRDCLDSMLRMDYPHDRLRFVIGYGESTDQSRRVLEDTFTSSDVAYIIIDDKPRNPLLRNALYLADVMNFLQSQLADEDYILYLDADIVGVPNELLKTLIKADKDIVAPCPISERNPGEFVFYDNYVFRDLNGRDFTSVARNPKHPWLRKTSPVEMMSIGTMGLVTRRVANEVHWDNPIPWLQYCLEARRKNFHVWALPFLRIKHASVRSEEFSSPQIDEKRAFVEEFVHLGILPQSELKKVKTLRGRHSIQYRLRMTFPQQLPLLRKASEYGLRLAPQPTSLLIRKVFPNSTVQRFHLIAKALAASGPSMIRDPAKAILYVSNRPFLAYEECSLFHDLGCTVVNTSPLEHYPQMSMENEKSYLPPDFEYWLERANEVFTSEEFDRLRGFDFRQPVPDDLKDLIRRKFDTIIVVQDPLMIQNLIVFAADKRFVMRLVQRHHGWYRSGMFNDFFVFPNFFICPGTEWERSLTPDIVPRLTVVPVHITEKRLREYVGDSISVLTASSDLTKFPIETRSDEFNQCVEGFPHLLTGRGNSSYPDAVRLDYRDYIEALADYRVHLSNGYGRSAKYALKGFIIESMMCGAPVVTLSNLALRQIFDNETNGFCSNNIPWLRERIRELLEDLDYAKRVGKSGQDLARILWSKERAKVCWEFVLGHGREESVSWLREEKRALPPR